MLLRLSIPRALPPHWIQLSGAMLDQQRNPEILASPDNCPIIEDTLGQLAAEMDDEKSGVRKAKVVSGHAPPQASRGCPT